MTAPNALLEAHATEMLGIFRNHRLERIASSPISELSVSDAYRVQDAVVRRRLDDGENVVGWKVGCTSRAIQSQFGLSEQINGRILAPHVHASGVVLDTTDYVDLAIEPEFVLRIGRTLHGHDLADAELRSAIAGISAGIEVHNYRFFHGPATSQELIASNGIHAAQVVADEVTDVGDADLSLEGVGVFVDDQLVASGIGAEIMGGPFESLRWLVGHLTGRGMVLEAGSLVIPGSPVELIRIKPGQVVEARFTRFGRCEASFA